MSTVGDLRTGLANRVATISGLRTSATVPDNPTPPQAVVYLNRIDYDVAMGRGCDEYEFTILVIVGRAADRVAQTSLDVYCDPSGMTSIKAAVEGDTTLGGKALDCRIKEMRSQSSITVGDTTFLTAEFICTVLAN